MDFDTLNIRADADAKMGTGHVMRCIALGQEFKRQGGHVNFISNCDVPALKLRIKNEGFTFWELVSRPDKQEDLEETLRILNKKKADRLKQWLVLDGYHFGEDFQKSFKDMGFKLMTIDDYNHHPFYFADLLLNQNIGAKYFQYKTFKNTVILKGLKYALIRNEFTLPPIVPPARSEIKYLNILVTMGGADPCCITADVIKILKRIEQNNIKVKIIIGPANPMMAELKSLIKTEKQMELIENGDMPALMRWADLAITAAGSTCIELCLTGIPFLTIVTADNQQALAQNFEKKGVSVNMGWFSNKSKIEAASLIGSFLKDTHKREKMAIISKTLVDGRGPSRIIRHMERIISDEA